MKKKLKDAKLWQQIAKDERYSFLIKQLDGYYEEFCKDKPIQYNTFNEEIEYMKSGERTFYEKKYFSKRSQLTIYALYAMLYPEKDEYLKKLEDVICAICDEYTWQLPAHRSKDFFNKRDGIDLFAAETGLYLAEIKYMLAERLNPYVTERISNELDWRIIKAFRKEHKGFEDVEHNWVSVCGGSVGAVFLYENPEAFTRVKNRIDACMEKYVRGINEDASCGEGPSYWNYGFSFYIIYCDLVRQFTCGEDDKFKIDKVRRYAEFLTNMFLGRDTVASYSDCSGKLGDHHLWTPHFLKNEYGIDVPPTRHGSLSNVNFSCAVRSFLYYVPEYHTDELACSRKLYDKFGLYVERKDGYGFSAKAGNNGEFHNHNDIGSFIVAEGGKQVLCDLGTTEYTRESFGEKRYDCLNMSSLGHSVPIINGLPQKEGKEYYGILEVSDNIVTIDLKNAYPIEIDRFIRKFELNEDSICLVDSFSEDLDVTERFVTEVVPEQGDGFVKLGKTRLLYDKSLSEVSIGMQTTKAYKGRGIREVYLIDIKVKKGIGEFALTVRFDG